MRKFTFLLILLWAGMLVQSQTPVVTPVWEHSVSSTAVWEGGVPIVPGTVPSWMGNVTERGMALYDGKLYIMSRKVTPPVIQVLDAATGNPLSTIPVDTAIVKGGTYAVNDLTITPTGKILFGNLSTNTKSLLQPFKVYMMSEKSGGGWETKVLVSWNSKDSIDGIQQPIFRLGDGFTCFGDISAEEDGYLIAADANATAPISTVPRVFRWNVQAGVVNPEPQIIELKSVYPAPVGTALPKLGISPRIHPLTNDLFWADGHSVYPSLYNMQGELLSTFTGKFKPVQPGISGVAFFSFKGKDFILAPATNHAAPAYAKKAQFELFHIPAAGAEAADSIAIFPELGLGGNTNSSYASPMAVDVQPDQVLMYFMSPYNGLACYKLVLEGGGGGEAKDWNISDAAFNALGTIAAPTTVDGLTIYATSEATVIVEGNNKTLEEVNYTSRLKLGGSGGFDTEGKPVARVLAFQVAGPSKITVIGMSSSSGTDRVLNIAAGTKDNLIAQFPALGPSISKGEYDYTGGATTIYLYSPSSGVNLYRIKVAPTGVGAVKIEKNQEISVFPNPAREFVKFRFSLAGSGFASIALFNASGQMVKMSKIQNFSNGLHEMELQTSDLNEGIYVYQLRTSEKTHTGKLQITR